MTMWPLLIPTAMPAIVASFDYLTGASRRREAGGEMSAIVSDAGGGAEDERIVFACCKWTFQSELYDGDDVDGADRSVLITF